MLSSRYPQTSHLRRLSPTGVEDPRIPFVHRQATPELVPVGMENRLLFTQSVAANEVSKSPVDDRFSNHNEQGADRTHPRSQMKMDSDSASELPRRRERQLCGYRRVPQLMSFSQPAACFRFLSCWLVIWCQQSPSPSSARPPWAPVRILQSGGDPQMV